MTECPIPSIGLDDFHDSLIAKAGQTRTAYCGTIEVTPYCNMKCVHCYITHCNWNAEILSYAELCHIIDEIAEEGCLVLLLTGGEPLVRNDFLDIYTYAKKKGIFVILFTNGTLVTPEIARYLHDWPPRAVEISIYGATKETYESITGVAGSFECCLRGIELLLEQGINLHLKTMLMTLNKHEYWEMKELAKSYGVKFRLDPIINPALDGSRYPCNLRLSPEEIVRLDIEDPERREGWIEAYSELPKLPLDKDDVFICGAGKRQFHIDALGRLQLCALAREPSYDLRQGTFHDGWHNFLPNVISQKLTQPSPCRSCSYRATCPVCPGWAQLEYGTSIEQPIEFLCEIERLRSEFFSVENNITDTVRSS